MYDPSSSINKRNHIDCWGYKCEDCKVIERECTYSNMKNNPLVTRMRPSVKGRTPLWRATIILPSQKKRFFPGNTSHFRCGFLVFSGQGREGGVGVGVGSAWGSICWYSQFFIATTRKHKVTRRLLLGESHKIQAQAVPQDVRFSSWQKGLSLSSPLLPHSTYPPLTIKRVPQIQPTGKYDRKSLSWCLESLLLTYVFCNVKPRAFVQTLQTGVWVTGCSSPRRQLTMYVGYTPDNKG